MARRLAASVQIRGGGRVGSALARLLGGAGVGKVAIVDPGSVGPADLGPAGWRSDDLTKARDGSDFGTLPRPKRADPDRFDLFVLASDDGADEAPHGAPDGPHLCAWVCESAGGIGPLMVRYW